MAEYSRTFRELLDAFPALVRLRTGNWGRRIPIVRQATAADCGAACLSMVLGYHGKQIPLDEVRAATGADDQAGLTAADIVRAAESYGLRARGLQLDDLDQLIYLPRGSILHWQFAHFVVLEKATKSHAVILDPAGGRRRVSRRQLDASFTGIALALEPTERFEKENRPTRGIYRYLRQFLAHSEVIQRTLVISVFVRLLALATPFLTGLIVDRVVPRGDVQLLTVLSAGLAAITVFTFLSYFLRSHLLLLHRTRLDTTLSLNFLEHLVSLPYQFFQQRTAGDLIMRLGSNKKIRETLTSSALSSVLDGTLAGLYLILLFAVHVRVAVIVLLLALVRILLYAVTRRRYKELAAESLEVQAATRNYEVQLLAGIGTLKAMGAEQRAVSRWSDLFVDELNVGLAQGRILALFESLLWAVGTASPFIVLVYGAQLVMSGELTLGMMLAVSALATGFLSPLSELLANTGLRLEQLDSYLERIDDVFSTAPEQDAHVASQTTTLHGAVALEGVSFRYGQNAPFVVRDVSVEIRPGSFVAIVGVSGAGKSTLAHLVLGLYQSTEGRVLFDGQDLRSLDLRNVRQQLGIVPQDPYLFGDSIRRNITLSSPNIPLHQVIEAARLACIHDDIMRLPMGYDTMLATGGHSLSGGQAQRIALARALVHRPAILLLDEATSHLDAIQEKRIQQNLAQLRCTRIVIAHRLSTIKAADLILVLHHGRLAEKGTHDELLRHGGWYSSLVAAQREREEPEKGRHDRAPSLEAPSGFLPPSPQREERS